MSKRLSRTLVMAGLFFCCLLLVSPLERGCPTAGGDEGSKIDPELLEKIENADESEKIPIFILFTRQAEEAEFSEQFARLAKTERRDQAIAWLKELAASTMAEFRAWLTEKKMAMKTKFGRGFWLVNGIEAGTTPEDIRGMSVWPGIARIFLRTEKPAIMIKQDKSWAGLNLRTIPKKAPFKGPFHPGDKELTWNIRNMRVDKVWELGFTGRGVVIAILDSGVNYTHPDIRNNLWINPGEIPENGQDDDGNGYVDDLIGWNFAEENQNVVDNFFHGSESAGILVGDGASGIVTGVAPQASLMILKTYAYDKTRRFSGRYLWQAFQYDKWLAFEYALENGAHIASLSFDYQPSEKPLFAPWRYVMANATYCGLIIVAGAGNSRSWLKTPHQITPPANVPEVIAVGGNDRYDRVDRVSSRGPVTWALYPPFDDYAMPDGLIKPDVCAPIGRFPLIHWSSDGYKYHTQAAGTSLSAPNGAGVAALMLERDSELTPAEVKRRLEETSLDLMRPGKDSYSGWGRINAFDAVNYGLYPNINLGDTEIACKEELWVAPGENFDVKLTFRISAAPLYKARISVSCSDPVVTIDNPVQDIADESGIPSGKHLAVDFSGVVEEINPASRIIRLRVFFQPDRGRKYFFTVPLTIGTARVLVVDDDGEGMNEEFVFSGLEKAGRPFHSIDTQQKTFDGRVLDGYKSVIWLTGEEFERTLSEEEQEIIKDFLNRGGRLFLLGDNIGDDIGQTDFYRDILHAEIIKDRLVGNYWREKPYMITGKPADVLSDRLALPVYTYYKQYDLIRPREGADDPFTGQDEDNYMGFVRFEGDYKLVYTSLGMEAVEDLAARAELMDRILTWFEK